MGNSILNEGAIWDYNNKNIVLHVYMFVCMYVLIFFIVKVVSNL